MKKTFCIILSALIIVSSFIGPVSADKASPYIYKDEEGFYYDLPNPGNTENGNVLIDYELAKITVLRTRYMTDSPEYVIDLLIENKSDNDFYISSSGTAIVDGYAYECFCYEEIRHGELEVAQLYIVAEDFKYPDIVTPQEIKFNIAFSDCESSEFLDIAYFAIYPSGLSAERVMVTPIEYIGYSDMDYYNDEYECSFRIIDARMQENGEFYQIDILLENKSDEHRVFSLHDVVVENSEIDPYWYAGVPAKSKMISHIYLYVGELELHDPNSIDSMEFSFHLDNYEETLLEEHMVYVPAKG